MRNCRSYFGLVLVAGIAWGTGSPAKAASRDSLLVLLRGAKIAELGTMPSFVPYHFDENAILGRIAAVDTGQLRRLAEEVRPLRPVSLAKPVYWIRSRAKVSPLLADGIEVLASTGEVAVAQVDPTDAAALVAKGLQLEIVEWSPKPLPRRQALRGVVPVGRDTIIQRVLDEVSAVALREAVQRLQDFQTRYTYSDSIVRVGQWLYDRFRSFGYEEVRFDTFYVNGRPHRNVIAVKRGVIYPDSVIMLGGHYDSIVLGSGTNPLVWAPGADDNASGTAATLEAARVLAHHQLEATIQFACWDAEEIGLVGSTSFADNLFRRKGHLSFYINFDMIGNLDPRDPQRDMVIYTDERSQPYAEMIAEMARTYTSLVPQIPGNTSGSDHRPFQLRGYPAVYVQEGDFSPHWHRPTDTVDNIDFDYMREVVQAGLATAIHLAGLADNYGDRPYVKCIAHRVDDDAIGGSLGNGNGYVDAGERIELSIEIKNFGNRTAQGLKARLKTEDPLVQILVDSVSGPDLAQGGVGEILTPFVLRVDPSAPNGHEIKFTVQISDASGDCWGSSLKLVVAMPHIIFSRQTPREAKGNGDDRVDPGEQWLLSVELQNTGLREAAQLGGSLRSLSPVIRVLDSLATFREVRVGSTTENLEDPFVVEVSTSGQRFEIVPLELHLRETGGFYEAVISFYLAIGQGRVLLVEDDGTADFRKHYADAVNRLGLATRHWDTALEGSVPLDTLRKYSRVVWYVGTDYGNSLFRQGTDNVEAYLAEGGRLFLNGPAAVFVLRSRPLFTQYLRSSYINYNTGLHRLTTGGQNEVLGEIAFWLSQEGPNKQGMPTEIEVADPAFPILFYDRDTPEGNGNIRSRGIGASAVATGNYRAVYFAFGWEGIQDPDVRREVLARVLMWLQGEISGVPGGETCLPTDLALEANYPNPFNASTTIVFRVAEKAYARLAVYDARGRLVRTLLEAELPPGRHRILFDAKDERGASLSSGVYLCRLEVGDKQVVRKMVLTK